MKQNDWIIAGLASPDMSTSEFLIAGLNIDNTQLLTKEQYKKSSFVRDRFTENGVFNEDAFDTFYKKRASEFGRLQSLDVKDTFMYDPFDTRAKDTSLIQSPEFKLQQVANPNRQTITLTGDVYEGNMSQRERAQQNKIWDSERGEWSEDTLNDRALVNNPYKWFKSLFEDPLVYATYDEDGEHHDQFTGQMVKHRKGQYKLNQYGLPYTETLNGRSLIGKEVVSSFDTLTVDGEGINKYDFFDSDDLDKSVAGTVAKSVAAIAPLLMGPYVSAIYSGVLVSRELMKTLPMLYGLTTAWSDNSEDSSILNTLAAMGQRFTSSTSDYGKSSMLNTEALATMVTDVALQWGQQKVIANTISKLRGGKSLMQEAYNKAGTQYALQRTHLAAQMEKGNITKEAFEKYVGDPKLWQESIIGKKAIQKFTEEVEPLMKNASRLGADASLVYMALVSNTDVYQSMLEAGATKKEAAAVALGSTIGMFSVDRYLGLGELFFDDLTASYENQIRRTFRKEASNWYDNVIRQNVQEQKKTSLDKFRSLFQSGVDFGKKHAGKFAEDLKYHTTGFVGKAIGEGLEEVSEEFVSDVSKAIYELAGVLGVDTSVNDVGAFKDWHKRYGMSFLGGTIGGGLFYGVNVYQNGKFSIDQTQDELIYLVRNNRTNEALEMLEKWRKKGKLGSKDLSTKTTKDDQNQDIFVTAENEEDSQNEFIYRRIKETILSLENVINENNAGLSEDQLFEKMIMSEARFRDLQKYLNLQEISYTTGYQRDYQRVLSSVIDLEAVLRKAEQTRTGIVPASDIEFANNIITDEQLRNLTEDEKAARKKNLKKIQDDLKEAKDELDRFLTGEYSIGYTEKMLFALDNHLNEDFVTMTYEQWLNKNHYGKTPSTLSPAESEKYKEEYLKYKSGPQELDLTQKFNLYKAIKGQIDPVLLNIQQNQDQFKVFQQEIATLFSSESPINQMKQYSYDDVLDFVGETEESDFYINRNDPSVRAQREETVMQQNLALLDEYKNNILQVIDKAGGFIDPVSRRRLKLILGNRNKDVVKNLHHNASVTLQRNNSEIDPDTQEVVSLGTLTELDKSILQLLETVDVNNMDKVDNTWSEIASVIKEDYTTPVREKNKALARIVQYLQESGIAYDPYESDLIGSALQEMIEYQLQSGKTIDQIFDINNADLYYNDFQAYGLTSQEVAAFVTTIRNEYEKGTLKDYEWSSVDLKNFANNDLELQKELSYYSSIFKEYISSINTNPIINLNKELDNRVSNINPVVELVKSLGLSMNTDMNSLEKILQDLDSRLEETDDIHDLILTNEEKESFQEAVHVIQLAKAYLYAASATPNIISPFGHNATINEFAENHRDVYSDFQTLPVLSVDVAAMYENELNHYLELIGIEDKATGKYSPGSWMWLSNQNEADKAQRFIRADKAWSKASYDLFANTPDAFKFSYNGQNYNLLDGMETIPQVTENTQDSLVHLNKLFNIFYNNVQDLVKQGWSYKQIWERSGLLEKITKIENVPLQKTCSLDESITVDRMTDYDKAVFLTTIAAMDSTKFYSYLRSRIDEEDGIAPITIQEWVSRVGIAQIENPEIFSQTLEYIKQKTGDSRPIIYGVYVGGNAGAGKSRVVGRNIAKYIKGNNIWISTPKESQINTLFDSTSKGVKMLNRDELSSGSDTSASLMTRIGVNEKAYKEAFAMLVDESVMKDAYSGKLVNNQYFSITETPEALVLNINPGAFGVKTIENAPDTIIIDEATHLSNLELQLLSAFSKLNNTRLIFLGDNKQRGYTGIGRNIDREQCLTIRTPNLGISLRDNNIQHQFNLNILESLINQLSDLENDDRQKYETQVNAIKSLLKGIRFKVYTQDDIHGELITKELTTQYVSKLKGTVGYVGRKQSSALEALTNSELDVTVLQEVDIQGQEFDYVVIDKDFVIPNSSSNGVVVLNFLQDLYTMISRGRKGSIIIDPSGKLQEVIGTNRVEFAKAEASSIASYTESFRNNKIELLDKVLGSQEANKQGTEQKDDVIKIILDKDFNIDDLGFESNYYISYQLPFKFAQEVLDNGLTLSLGANGTIMPVNRDALLQLIDVQKNGEGYDKSDSIILMEFPKETFGNSINQVLDKVQTGEEFSAGIPSKYIKNIIHTIPTEIHDDIRTDKTEIVEKPILTEEDLGEIEIDQDELPTDSEDIPDNPMLCYGGATLTGMEVEIRDGKQVWINPESTVKRDGQIFTDQKEIVDTQQQIDLSNKIREFKNSFLYRKGYTTLPKYITDIVSEEEYNSVKWFIEARSRSSQDNFIRNTAFKEDKIEISSKNLIFSIVGEVKLRDGSIGTITLGLMGNPKNWIDQVPNIKKRVNKKISKLQSKLENQLDLTKEQRTNIEAKIERYKAYLGKLNLDNKMSDPIVYEAYIEEIAGRFDGANPVRIQIPTIITPGLTDLHKQHNTIRISRMSKSLIKNAEHRIAQLRLALQKSKGDTLLKSKIQYEISKTEKKLEKFRTIQDQSFRSLNPYTTVSPMYIYTPNSAVRNQSDIDDSIIGKCNVVFVTNEEGLSPDELVDIYISQKNQTEQERKQNGIVDLKDSSVIPSVRMVVLDNLGVSFQDMSNPYLAESMKSEVSFTNSKGKVFNHSQIYPFKTNFMGIRMYVGLWNFRANLLQFQKQFDTFAQSLPIKKDADVDKFYKLVDEYLTAKDLKWRGDNGRELSLEEKDFLNKHQTLENFDQFSKLVDEFNDFLGNKVKQFRLGSDFTNGAYIRYLTGDTNALYNSNDKVNGIYINASTLKKYVDIVDSLFENVLDHIVTCDYTKDRLLSTKEGVKNSFANHITSLANRNGQIDITDAHSGEKATINFGSAYDPTKSKGILNTFSHIPAVLSKVFKFTSIRQSHIMGDNFDTKDEYSIRIKSTIQQDGKDVTVDEPIPYWKLWKHVDMIESRDEFDISAIEGHVFDPTLSNFFSFAFHGTLEDVNDRGPQRSDDALFPYGFFADPLSTTEQVMNGANKMFTKSIQQQLFFGADVRVGDPTFFISMKTLQESVEQSKEEVPIQYNDETLEECINIINTAIEKYPSLREDFEIIQQDVEKVPDDMKTSYARNSIQEVLEKVTKNNFENIFSGTNKNINSAQLVEVTDSGDAISLEQMMQRAYQQKFGEELPPIVGISVDGKSLIVDSGDITTKVSRGMGGTINISKLSSGPVVDSVVVSTIKELISSIQSSLKPAQIEELSNAVETYNKIPEDQKQAQKQVIAQKLKRIGQGLMTKRQIYQQIRQAISKISEPNCI